MKMQLARRVFSVSSLTAAVLTWCFVSPAWSQSQSLDKLLRPLPHDTNVISVIHVDEIMKSPRAITEGWASNPEQNFLAGADTIPTWVEMFVVGIHVHPGPIDDVTTVAVVPVPEGIGLEQVSSREAAITGGAPAEIEALAGCQVMKSYRGAYFAELEQGVLGAMRPGVRQDVSRWIRELNDRSAPVIDSYLQAAAHENAHIILAMDLQDLPEPQNVRDRVALLLPANAPKSRIDHLTQLLVGIRGITLRTSIRETSPSQIEIQFTDKVAGHSQNIVALFQDILSDHGLALHELDQPKIESTETSVILSFEMSDESLRNVLSLLAGPRPGDIGKIAENVTSRVKVDVESSRRYWTSVNKSLDDLDRAQRRASNVAKVAGWHDTHAKKIENLPIDGVDPALVDYGLDVSSKLHTLASSLRGVAVEVDTQGRTLTYEVSGDPGYVSGGWGWGNFGYRPPTFSVNSNLQQVRERQAEAIRQGEQQRQEIWNLIRNARTEMEKQLRKQYGVDF